jgi:hypothetical protein
MYRNGLDHYHNRYIYVMEVPKGYSIVITLGLGLRLPRDSLLQTPFSDGGVILKSYAVTA